MKSNIYILLTLLALVISNASSSGNEKPSFGEDDLPEILRSENLAECSIYNKEQDYHFLMAERYARYGGMIRNVSLPLFSLFTDAKQGVWQFIPVPNLPNGFFLRNLKFGEDLFASNDFVGINQKRREVFTWRYQKHFHLNEKSFMWIIKRSNEDANKYSIWNVAYKEPLYAGTWAWKGGVFTWHKDNLDHKQFFWTFKCKGKFPI